MSKGQATALGFVAVLLWAVLAVLTVAAAPVPPFQLNAMCFALGGVAGIIWAVAAGKTARLVPPGRASWVLGVGGLFGYHALYFTALRHAPPAEASLIAYLWPLLIVLFSGLLPGEVLRAGHVAGAVISFAGAGLLLMPGPGGFDPAHWVGYAAATACALTWSSYSVLSRRLAAVPTESVALFCLAAAALSAVLHLLTETTAWPVGAGGWLAVLGLGLGPVGLAFFVWDVGVKRGNIQLLGTAAYAAPLLSTLVMIAAGYAQPGPTLIGGALLIAGGAAVAARAGRRKLRPV